MILFSSTTSSIALLYLSIFVHVYTYLICNYEGSKYCQEYSIGSGKGRRNNEKVKLKLKFHCTTACHPKSYLPSHHALVSTGLFTIGKLFCQKHLLLLSSFITLSCDQ